MTPETQIFQNNVLSPSPPQKILEASAEPLTCAEGEPPRVDNDAYLMLKKFVRPGTSHLSLAIPKTISSLTAVPAPTSESIDSGLDVTVSSSDTPPSAPTGLQDKSLHNIFQTGGELTPEVGSLPTRPVFPRTERVDSDVSAVPVVPEAATQSVECQVNLCSCHQNSNSKFIPGTHITLQDCGNTTYAYDLHTQEHFVCKLFTLEEYHERLRPYFFLDYALAFLQLIKVIEEPSSKKAYALFEINEGGDLHSYIRQKKRLREDEARQLLEPIFKTIAECHHNNFLVRQLKLRQCVFLDHTRTQLVLQGLEEGKTLAEESDDLIYDRSGCPAYVSPEVVSHAAGYSGRGADVWAAGVVLYTALVGKYPFQTSSTSSLLAQVREAKYTLPAWLSLPARDLLSAMLSRDPDQRINMDAVLEHSWFVRKVKTTPRPVPVGLVRAPVHHKARRSKCASPHVDGPMDVDYEVPGSQEAFFAQACL